MEDIKKLEEVLKKYQTTQIINRGIGPLSLLGVALVVLKSMGYISIPWFLALAPFWVPIAFAILIVIIMLIVISIVLFSMKDKIEQIGINVEENSNEEVSNKTCDQTSTQVKPKRKRPKRKKEAINNGESTENTNTGTEGNTNAEA